MGRVYRAEQTALGRTVAVKVIHPHLLGDEQTVARFYTEARASSRLNHPNSVSIIDFGRTDDGILYLAMEYLQGKDLAIVMHEEGPLPFRRIADALIGVLGALGEAHALGVVHRDLKPENIIIKRFRTGGDLVKVVDFGLATIVSGQGATSITSPGLVCGTPDYMSPEQGRGEQVDGRGDLYSLGVVLFELLTDRLPFEDETPTKVVLRHINDPVPDPQVTAPQRHIPDPLARVAMKALSKSAKDRYQNAEEMAQALRGAMAATQKVEDGQHLCPSCGAPNPVSMRFCGACGHRLAGAPTTPAAPTARPRASFYPARESSRPLLGRGTEIARLRGMRDEAVRKPLWAHVTGEPGVGKTRLLEEIAREAEGLGDAVVGSGPHPLRAPVPYWPIRVLVAALLGVEEGELERLSKDDGIFAEPLVRAGIAELVRPVGLAGFEDRSRAGAVAAALATAIRVAAGAASTERTILVVDDLNACDGLTQQVLKELPHVLEDTSVLLLTSGYHGEVPGEAAQIIPLSGLDPATADAFLKRAEENPTPAQVDERRRVLPLYLEQVEALGASSGLDESLPPRLADALAQRLERLDISARRVLQAASVVGDRCPLGWLRKIVDPTDTKGLEHLTNAGLVHVMLDHIVFSHPFVRDLVEASIPAEARRGLHEKVLEMATDENAPLEVRAEHGYRAGEPMSALVLLERMGDAALSRGDAKAAVLAFRRALELARREMLEKGDVMLEGAIVSFSRKLGEALEKSDEVAGADGVLREALDLAGPASLERARMLLSLGRVAARRDRRRDALRLLGQALETATTQRDRDLESRVHTATARVRREDGDAETAATSLARAVQIEEEIAADPARRARTSLTHAEVLLDLGELDLATQRLEEVILLADKASAGALVAEAVGLLGMVDHHRGDRPEAAARYREAADKAAQAGDAIARERWQAAANSLV